MSINKKYFLIVGLITLVALFGLFIKVMNPSPTVTTPNVVLPPTTDLIPVTTSHIPEVYYSNCDEAPAPIERGEPGYRSALDRNDDGVACETAGFTNYGLIVELAVDKKMGDIGYAAGMDFFAFESTEDQVHVLLPYNGQTAWLNRSEVYITEAKYKIEVHLSDHKMLVLHDGEIMHTFEVGVGVADSPTPTGWFYVWEHQVQADPDGAYGPHAFGISAFSDSEDVLPGGEGRIGFHGTNQPEILPGDVSHGCIRLSNDDILKLVDLFPLGTPVEITE